MGANRTTPTARRRDPGMQVHRPSTALQQPHHHRPAALAQRRCATARITFVIVEAIEVVPWIDPSGECPRSNSRPRTSPNSDTHDRLTCAGDKPSTSTTISPGFSCPATLRAGRWRRPRRLGRGPLRYMDSFSSISKANHVASAPRECASDLLPHTVEAGHRIAPVARSTSSCDCARSRRPAGAMISAAR